MKFPYREYVGPLPGTNDYRLILRPVITVQVSGPLSRARMDALVDTGADETLLPMSLADILGVDLDRSMSSKAVGISGESMAVHYGEVDLQIDDGNDHARWTTTVGFVDLTPSDETFIIFGHGGCLDYFIATFDGANAELELCPSSLFPS